ncbi:hypothetical protein [Loigolactobacillus jiayinensis]|uniref:Uncharacterized protein n=1 Tax=Loigolactobacillus jiayinensis TaxID=2486016 RepID=A0ABW1REG0_9LACO|nr:hypothetical protein [Loigolactobacillus jiayinensis]
MKKEDIFKLKSAAEVLDNLVFYTKLMTLFENTESVTKKEATEALNFYREKSLENMTEFGSDNATN